MTIDPVTTQLTVAAASEAVKVLVTKLLDRQWSKDTEIGKSILEQLTNEHFREQFISKYVTQVLKVRTLINPEKDTYLTDIYSPLKMICLEDKSEVQIGATEWHFDNRINNIIGIAGQGKSTVLKQIFWEEMIYGYRFPILIDLKKLD